MIALVDQRVLTGASHLAGPAARRRAARPHDRRRGRQAVQIPRRPGVICRPAGGAASKRGARQRREQGAAHRLAQTFAAS